MTVVEIDGENMMGDDSIPLSVLGDDNDNDNLNTSNNTPVVAYEEDCDYVRGKISEFLAEKTMTQLEFLKIISCSTDSLRRFMKLKGNWNGTHNSVYWAAKKYFLSISQESESSAKKRKWEQEQLNQLKKTKLQMKLEKRALKSYNKDLFESVLDIQLLGENESKVPVYDSCDEIREKSLDFIDQCGLRTKEWLRLIGNVNTKSWNDFLSYQGEKAGASNRSYYYSYVFLEKVRIVRNDEKSPSRLLAEQQFGEAGRPLLHDSSNRALHDFHQGILKCVQGIRLEREDENKVPVYDDCDSIRKKSCEFIANFGVKTSEWLRFLGSINSKSWKDFLSYKGERAGAANRAYYNAYVFLEKLRIALNEDKDSARILAELQFGEEGRPLKHDQSIPLAREWSDKQGYTNELIEHV